MKGLFISIWREGGRERTCTLAAAAAARVSGRTFPVGNFGPVGCRCSNEPVGVTQACCPPQPNPHPPGALKMPLLPRF